MGTLEQLESRVTDIEIRLDALEAKPIHCGNQCGFPLCDNPASFCINYSLSGVNIQTWLCKTHFAVVKAKIKKTRRGVEGL